MPNDYQNPSLSPAAAMNRVFEDSIEYLQAPPKTRTLANLVQAGRVRIGTTKDLEWVVSTGEPTAEGIGIYAASNLQSNSTSVPAKLSMGTKRIAHRFAISRIEMRQAASRGVGALRDLLGMHFQEALDSIMVKISNAIQNNDASTEIVSLSAVLDQTAAYAGIDPAVVTRWIPLVNTNGTPRAFNRDLMIDFDAYIETFGRAYDRAWMHPNTEVRYRKLFMDLAGAASLPNYTNIGQLKGADLGLGASSYNGMPIIKEPVLPEGEIRMTRLANMELFFFDLDMGANPQPGMPRAIDEVVNNSLGFPIRICSYPITVPTQLQFEFYTVCQLRVRNRQDAMAIKNLTTTDW